MPIKTFTQGEVLTSSDVNTYLMRQAVITCTSSTRPASPVDGMTIYQTDTDNTWVYDGAVWMPNTPLQPIKPTGATNGTVSGNLVTIGNAVPSVTVSGVFSSLYDNYQIQVSGGSASGSVAIGLTLGATNTGYYASGYSMTFAGTGTIASDNNGSKWTYAGVATSDSMNANIILNSPNRATRTYLYNNYVFGNPAGGGDAMFYSGYVNNTTQYTAFTLTPNTGTFTGGIIRVYGYR